MRSSQSDMPFPIAYLLVLAIQVPVWLCAGLLFGASMIVLDGLRLLNALVGGLAWGFFMWILVGNLMAVGLAWRRSADFPAPDRTAFRTALERACRKLRLIVLAASEDEIVSGAKWALVRLRVWDVRIEFAGGTAVLTAPALSFGAIRKAVRRALAEATASAQQTSQGQRHAERVAADDRPRD